MAQKIISRARRRNLRVVFRKYATVAVAACMIIALWGSGTLSQNHTKKRIKPLGETTAVVQEHEGVTQILNDKANNITTSLNRFFNNFSSDRHKENAINQEDNPNFKAKTPKEQEKVFEQQKDETKNDTQK